ncbi:MAG: T9SS type A sorting domain-containing protein [Calditrichaeota bacterium]|nr:T9SS type A sorting domain-containing protein [Calditrichota bacterium]MCB9369748.1 T9SS type A sorting domain-containing protein [Calditrichota bacterium]
MKKFVAVLCLCLFAVSAFAARSPQEIKSDMRSVSQEIAVARSSGSDLSALKHELIALRKELRALAPRHSVRSLDQGGDSCDEATVISTAPYEDNGAIDEEVHNTYDYGGDCGDDGDDVVYELVIGQDGLPAGPYSISACGSDFDTVIELWDSCPDADGSALVACNDDADVPCNDNNDGYSSCISGIYLEDGTYFIILFGYGFDQGDYILSFNPGSNCGDNGCLETAANSYPCNAQPVVLSGGSAYEFGISYEGALSAPYDYCGTYPGACGLWYSVVGTGNLMRAHTCDAETDYDTKINVYTGSCDALVCVDGNDDWDPDNNFTCDQNLSSKVDWCSEAGVTYYIFVNGFEGETGNFGLTVEDIGTPCAPPCVEQDYYFSLDQVPFCECLSICENQIQKIFVGPAGPNDRPVAYWHEGCQVVREIPPSGCDTECVPAYPVLYMDWIYLPDRELWCMDLYSQAGGCYCFCIDRILPVELNSFTAVAGDGEVALSWETGSESNLDRFEITRDGELLAQLNAANSSTGSTYSWTDESVRNGVVYSYTLSVVNLDGSREELQTQSVTPRVGASTATNFALNQNYPNPFNPETNISFSLPVASNIELSVVNAVGQEVAVLAQGAYSAGNHTVKFNGQNLASGIYFYTLKAGNFTAQHKMLLLK